MSERMPDRKPTGQTSIKTPKNKMVTGNLLPKGTLPKTMHPFNMSSTKIHHPLVAQRRCNRWSY